MVKDYHMHPMIVQNPERFDLFVKNFSGTQYIADLNELDEEAIYLTRDSKVTVASDGVADTGIENSVRVAFTQIGRVSGTTTDPDNITSIKLEDFTKESLYFQEQLLFEILKPYQLSKNLIEELGFKCL